MEAFKCGVFLDKVFCIWYNCNRDKQVSNPETTLVKQIEFADGRTIQYEYDEEERITKVTDSVDGAYEYTYDALGQLLTEKKNNVTVNTMTYDNYGNIKTKNGITVVCC